jgi:plasmid segregation protein ParM
MIVWSYDDGYGDNKLTDGVAELLIPSYVARFRPRMNQEIDPNKEPHPHDYIVIEDEDGTKCLVGTAAIKQDSRGQANLRDNKHMDKYFPYMFKACLGLLAKNEDTFVDVLVMGLPVEAEEDPERHALLQEMVVGKTHSFTLTLGDGTVLKRNIQIKELLIKKQPFGSQCDVMLDDNGEIADYELAGGYNVIADIGAGTFNVYTLNALEPVKDLSFHTFDGMYTAYDEVNQAIEGHTGSKLPTAKLPEIVNQIKEIQGINLNPDIDDAFDNLANTVVGILEDRCKNSWPLIRRIIWTGGGSELLKEYIESYMPKRNKLFLNRFSTARGLRKIGIRHFKKTKGKQNPPKSNKESAAV